MPDAFYFLPEDFQKLEDQIRKITTTLAEVSQRMGESCQDGADNWHDNFTFEDGTRQQHMWSVRLRELLDIRNRAVVITDPSSNGVVGIGRSVTVVDLDSGKQLTYRIGSYITFNGPSTISYQSPLGQLLLGARRGEVREDTVGGRARQLEVVAVA
jgi:transcription elongation GreA/GreB family factor